MKIPMSRWSAPATFLTAILLPACGGASSQTAPAAAAPAAAPADDGETQAARGARVYAENCASCHGAGGEGSKKSPPVVGKDALPLDPRPEQKSRKVQFHTALDVAQWVVKNMPPAAGGSLKESEYWDVLAFDLKANGVPVAGRTIDAKSAADIKLH
jgi:cytochrome c